MYHFPITLTFQNDATVPFINRSWIVDYRGVFLQRINCGACMQLPSGTHFYGTGEVSGAVERTGKRVSACSSVFTFISGLLLFTQVPWGNGLTLVLSSLDVGADFHACFFLQIYSWNTDAWGYNQNTTSLYQSHPWVFSILPNGQAFGVLADTTRRCEVSSETLSFFLMCIF